MQGELAQVQWVSLHMQGASFPLHQLHPCPNPRYNQLFYLLPAYKPNSLMENRQSVNSPMPLNGRNKFWEMA